MLRSIQLFTISLTFPMLLLITNPTKREYTEHMIWQFRETACQRDLPLETQVACASIKVLPHRQAAGMIANYSQRQDFLFFSLYTTNYFGLEDRSVGVGKLFWTID